MTSRFKVEGKSSVIYDQNFHVVIKDLSTLNLLQINEHFFGIWANCSQVTLFVNISDG